MRHVTNTGDYQRHDAKWKKPDVNGHISYYLIDMTLWRGQDRRNEKTEVGDGRGALTTIGNKGILEGWWEHSIS